MEFSTTTFLDSPIGNYKPAGKSQLVGLSHHFSADESINANPFYRSINNYVFNPERAKAVSVFDIAEYLLCQLGEQTTMKLHKLAYYCQAWSLVWDEKILFNEEIEAWANGPVIRPLFYFHKGLFSLNSVSIGNPQALDESQKETVNSVIEYYGHKSSQWLIELTHLEDPWKKARKGLAPTERGNNIISLESMSEYYSSL